MDFTELSESRYSVRKFKDRPVSKEHMQIILRAAQLSLQLSAAEDICCRE